jgi:hypothetical protein
MILLIVINKVIRKDIFFASIKKLSRQNSEQAGTKQKLNDRRSDFNRCY